MIHDQDLQRIRRFVAGLVWRERLVIVARFALQAAFTMLVVTLVMLMAPGLRWDRSFAAAAVVLMTGVGLWAVAMPLVLRWRPSGDRVRQARLVESQQPDLRGRLLTAVERVDGPMGQESPAMLGLVARRAAQVLEGVRPGRIHPATRLIGWFGLVMIAWIALIPTALFVPGGPGAAATWWMSSLSAVASMASYEVKVGEEHARVGDLVIEYTYPSYTGLPSRVVPNSTGDVRGPPGTKVKVTARAAQPVEAAALVAYDEPALDADVGEEGRVVSGSFSIQANEGTYHLVLYQGGQPVNSRDFKIVPEPDLPPDVLVEVEGVIEVAMDEAVDTMWRARDDYGVRKVGLQVNGKTISKTLARPKQARTELQEALQIRPWELGLKPGDEASIRVVAWDNDTVSGSKMGVSRTIHVRVLGPNGLGQRTTERQLALRDMMLDILADFLEEPYPPGDGTGGELVRWGEALAGRYGPLEDLVKEFWQGFEADSAEARAVHRVTEAGQALIRYTQVAYTPGSRSRPSEAAFAVTADLRVNAVVSLEDGILDLDQHIKLAALAKVADGAENLSKAADSMEAALNAENPDMQELLAQLDALERMMAKLMQDSANLDNGGLKEFVNARQEDVKNLMDEIRKALAEGRLDDAREMMKRLAEQLRQMSEGIQDELNSAQESRKDSMRQANQLKQELERLEEQQRKLQSQVQSLREKGDAANAKELAALWKKIQDAAAQASSRGEGYKAGLEEHKRSFAEKMRATNALERTRELEHAAAARDLRGTKSALEHAKRSWRSSKRMLMQRQLGGQPPLVGPGDTELRNIERKLDEIERLIEKLEETSQQTDPEVAGQTQKLQEQQRQLEEELKQAQQQAKEMSREFPVRPRGMQESLDKAGERMNDADQDLGGGKPMQAEGSQGAAADRIREARDALEQAMKDARQQQQQLQGQGQGQGQGERKGKRGQDGDKSGDRDVGRNRLEIPQPEEFRTPEEYRRALLEGMEGEVPDEYRALKKKYYDDLVRQ